MLHKEMKTLDRMSFKSFHRMHHFKRRKITEKSWEFALWGHIWKQGYDYLGLLMCIYETLPKLVTFHRQKKKKDEQAKTNKNFRKCLAHNSSLTCLFIYTSYHFILWVFWFTVFWLLVCIVFFFFLIFH